MIIVRSKTKEDSPTGRQPARRLLSWTLFQTIVAECWHSSPAIVAYWQGNKPKQDGYASYLSSVMDFPLQETLKEGLETDSDGWMEGGPEKIYLLACG